ncbi:rab-GTPase-TBC domain-containing protein [Tricharina praecox]|uniref:rab-GTPase-TBC domain-containing protein n=1 Tax=Tricharina praecox TaxID=43433 RepID=UPI00222117A4|nr:rab-GTPase-TBC domain-containing protein [Tricharina praecox]KAI5854971.1 rab-GTPase-TBC domain-containing protein [Tricharina praecox]
MASSSRNPKYTPPASPSGSFYDLSDDNEDDYNTITHTSTGRSVKLLFSKSKVYIHPSASQKDNIPGFIALLQQKSPNASDAASSAPPASSILLAWVPESALGDAYDTYVKVDLIDADTPPRQSYLVPPPPAAYSPNSSSMGNYAFAVPVSQIYSMLIRPPNIGWWWGSLVINSRSGDSFPALFFHDSECASTIAQSKRRAKESFDPFGEEGGLFWGGDEVLRWLRRYANIEKSQVEPSLYLVDPTPEDLVSFISKSVVDNNIGVGSSSSATAGMDPITKVLKEARWSLLERLTRVTQFTRRTAEDILDSPKVPPQVKRLLKNPDVVNIQEEFDSARIYLARWAMGIAEQSEREQARLVWTNRDIIELEDTDVGEFEILEIGAGMDTDKRKPVSLEEWNKWFDSIGRLSISVEEVKERIFHSGIEEGAARKEIWLWLLDVYPWDSTRDERQALMNSKRDEYIRLKGKWWDDFERRNGDEYWRDQKNRIEKDVHRTDRNIPIFAGEDIPHPDQDSPFAEVGTNVHLEQMKDMLLTYNEYNTTLGYVQGMSDLLAPIYAVMQDDAVAFWAFVGFMERTERNFLRDQSGMRAQLVALDHLVQLLDPKLYQHLQSADSTNFFFFFRMLLVWFKREFKWDDVLRLWEVLWTNYYSSQYHLFIALAILERHRGVIMDHLKQFDEVLKYVNELSNTIDLNSTRVRAEALFRRFQRTIETVDRKKAESSGLPSPGKRPVSRKLGSSSANITPSATTTGRDGGKKPKAEIPDISEDLRRLLSKEVVRP